MSSAISELQQQIINHTDTISSLRAEISKIIVGQQYLIDRILLGLIADGHILIEGIPGLAKTTAVKAVAEAVQARFARVQFTPDLLPADLIGTEIYRPTSGEFTVKKGPIFTNLLLADEINRAPAKVQSALLEAMQERQVTIGETTHALPDPFLVLATQNPIEQEGTYPLPEAQVDRFMLKLAVRYPNKDEEKEIMRRMSHRNKPQLTPVVTPAEIKLVQEIADSIYIDARVEDYIVDIVFASREPAKFKLDHIEKLIEYGASPRATICLAQTAKVLAFLSGRAFVTPQEVKTIGPDVLRHRIIVSYEAEARELTSDNIINEIFNTVDVP
ncbi:MAG: MoxR family ATPase [Deltaproteobacteria bacterium]|nr:MoxR family ATPase [Deltaproteobacteria bacterium]